MRGSMHTAYSPTHGVVAYDTRTRRVPEASTLTVRGLHQLRRSVELIASRRAVTDVRLAMEAVVFLWRAFARRR